MKALHFYLCFLFGSSDMEDGEMLPPFLFKFSLFLLFCEHIRCRTTVRSTVVAASWCGIQTRKVQFGSECMTVETMTGSEPNGGQINPGFRLKE